MAEWWFTGVVDAGLIQLFWLSFICIGAGAILLAQRLYRSKRWCAQITSFISNAHWLVAVFILFCLGTALFIPPVAAAYIFEWPVATVEALYAVLLTGSVVMLILHRKLLIRHVTRRARALTRSQIILGLVVIVLVGAEFTISMLTGAQLNNDTPVHLAKLQMFMNVHHFSLTDPYLGYNGIIDFRYSTNIVSALLTVGAAVLHLPAYKIWFYSYAILQLVMTCSLFALAKTYLSPGKVPKEWFYIFLLLAPVYDGTYFLDYPELPHSIVLAWFSLLFIGLKLLLEKRGPLLLIVAASLIAATHAVSSLSAAVFLGLLGLILFLKRRLNRQQVIIISVLVILMALPAIVNLAMPVRSTSPDLAQTVAVNFHASGIMVKKIGWLVVPKFDLIPKNGFETKILDYWAALGLAVAAIYVWLAKKLHSSTIKLLLLWAVTLLVLESFNTIYMSIFGYCYLIYITKQKDIKLLLGLLFIFFAILAYDPVVLTILFGRIPLWLIDRFQDLNTFAFFAPLLGTFVLYRYAALKMGLTKHTTGYALLFLLLLASFFANSHVPINSWTLVYANHATRVQNKRDYATLVQLQGIDKYTKNQVVFINDWVSELDLPIVSSSTVGFINDVGSSQMENIVLRSNCNERISEHLSLSDLYAARVTRVVLNSKGGPGSDDQKLLAKAATLPYLHYIGQNSYEKVFSVQVPAGVTPSSSPACTVPYKQ